MFGKGCREAVRLNVNNESLNEKYLGMASDVKRSSDGAFKYLKDRVWKRVQGWMERSFLSGGKEVLIKISATDGAYILHVLLLSPESLVPPHQWAAA